MIHYNWTEQWPTYLIWGLLLTMIINIMIWNDRPYVLELRLSCVWLKQAILQYVFSRLWHDFPTFSQWRIVCFFCYLIYTQPFAKCTAKCKKYFWRAGFHIYWSFSTWDNHVKLQTDWFKHLENYTKETKKYTWFGFKRVSFLFMF